MSPKDIANALWDCAADLAIPRMETEYDLCCALLADFENPKCCRNRRPRDNPRELVVAAIDAGITAESFSVHNSDFRIIFSCLDELSVGSHTRLSQAAYLQEALTAGNWWDHGQRGQGHYSNAELAKMMIRYPYAPQIVDLFARKLSAQLKLQNEFDHRLNHLAGLG